MELPREPMMDEGDYLLERVSCEITQNPGKGNVTSKTIYKILDMCDSPKTVKVEDHVAVLFMLSGKGAAAGASRAKAMVVHVAGYDNDTEYDAFDPDGYYIDDFHGELPGDVGLEPLLWDGRKVAVNVRRGKSREDGGWYREYTWFVADDQPRITAQDVVPF